MHRRIDQAYQLGQQEALLRGYRLGVKDAQRLAEIRGQTVFYPGDGPPVAAINGEQVWPPKREDDRRLRLVDGDAS